VRKSRRGAKRELEELRVHHQVRARLQLRRPAGHRNSPTLELPMRRTVAIKRVWAEVQ
jgi:hypothetical protein